MKGIEILEGDPTPEDWRDIADLIDEGYTSGYERPVGINWTLNTEG